MKFNELIGKRHLGIAHVCDYANWAETLMCAGCDSDNIAILVGIGVEPNPDIYEVQKYFQKSIDDLNLTYPTESDALSAYAKSVCKDIISQNITSAEGINILASFYRQTDYQNAIWSIWDYLEDDMGFLAEGHECLFNTGLNRDNKSDYIKQVAEQFVEIIDMDLPKNFFDLCACSKCDYIGESILEVIDKPWMPEKLYRLLYKKGQTRRATCSKCKTPFPLNMNDFQGRKQYLEKLANQKVEPTWTTPVDSVKV